MFLAAAQMHSNLSFLSHFLDTSLVDSAALDAKKVVCYHILYICVCCLTGPARVLTPVVYPLISPVLEHAEGKLIHRCFLKKIERTAALLRKYFGNLMYLHQGVSLTYFVKASVQRRITAVNHFWPKCQILDTSKVMTVWFHHIYQRAKENSPLLL